jgi:hypothetical protein
MNQPARPNPAPSSSGQVGTIVIGAFAGLTVCAILSAILSSYQQTQAAAQVQVTS